MVPRNQIFACVIKQYGTGLYQACVSFNKGHSVFLSAHHDEEDADEAISRFYEACHEGVIKTAEDVLKFVRTLELGNANSQRLPVENEGLSLAA